MPSRDAPGPVLDPRRPARPMALAPAGALALAVAAALALLVPVAVLGQTLVLPERPGQNQVAWYPFNWQYVDVPAPGGGPGGVRLYYYRSAAAQARRALPAIRSAYARLVTEFAYVPTHRIPFVLYGTQREFQAQNVFEVSEAVLGVTSPLDLTMTVPYFGDHGRFVEVVTHELVHQFTIQKLLDGAGGDASRSPVLMLPLWFVEGIAEYYARGGLDLETEAFLRDLVWNPAPELKYQVVAFADDHARGYLPTYKLGQARLAFVAETYGRERIQAFLDHAGELGEGGRSADPEPRFAALVRRVLDEPLEQVETRWQAWLKRRYFTAYAQVRQDLPAVRELRPLPGEPERFVASPDGAVLLVRTIDRGRGQARLVLVDTDAPGVTREVAADDRPGCESLHPVDYGVMALADGLLAFSAQDGEGDRLTLRRWGRQPGAPGRGPRLELGPERPLEVRAPGGGRFVRIADLAFSPDGGRLAFVGTAGEGQQDVYVVAVAEGAGPVEARRLTDDAFAERDLAWGAEGIYASSDATEHGRFNLFLIDPASGARTRLTTGPHDDRFPRPLADGGVAFTTEAGGKADLARLERGAIRRLTDFATGLTGPFPAPQGRGLLATTFHGGRFRLVEVPRLAWLDGPGEPVTAAEGTVLPIPEEALPGEPRPYRATSLENWRPETGLVYGGGTGSAVAGRAAVLFDDFLRDDLLLVDVAAYGSFENSQALVLYERRGQRLGWALGAFQTAQQQLDRLDPALAYTQRDFGLVGVLKAPLDRFRRAELELSVAGEERYCLSSAASTLALDCAGVTSATGPYADTAAWRRLNGGLQAVVTPTLRLGYDTVRLDPLTGPLDRTALQLELGASWVPSRRATSGFARLEASTWWQLVGRSNLMLRLAGASSLAPDEVGRRWERTWWLSAADNLRGYTPFDFNFLVGQHYWVSNLELQVPLDSVIHLPLLEHLEGVAAMDFGGVFNHWSERRGWDRTGDGGAWGSRTLTGVLGVNVLLGPILLRLHWGHPWDVGGVLTPALVAHEAWVTNVTLRYFFF